MLPGLSSRAKRHQRQTVAVLFRLQRYAEKTEMTKQKQENIQIIKNTQLKQDGFLKFVSNLRF